MCGICGFANYKNEPLLKAMTAVLEHRGPDEDGFFASGGRVSLGMRRLKIIDLSTGSQPVFNEDGTVAVVFNGEIYNFKELRAELQAKGHRFRTGTDTEVLVHLYEEHGAELPARLRGMFAFALWDAKKETLLLARDHFGIKPLFYAQAGDKLFFASEIKSLLLCPEVPSDLDLRAVDAYFSYLYSPGPHTVYRRVRKLEPAQTLTFRGGRASLGSYWSMPEFSRAAVRSEGEYLEGITDLLEKSVREQLVSDVPLGLLLSGGMDSTTALCYMAKASAAPVKTFTVGYGPKDASFNETDKARLAADAFGTEHHETILEPDIRAVMEKLAAQFDEPFADASAIPTYLVTKEARRSVTVALTGIGGDEIFGGYPRHLGARLLPHYLKTPGFLREGLWAGAKYLSESTASNNLPGRIKRFLRGAGRDFRSGYESWISYFSEGEKAGLYAPGMMSVLSRFPYRLPGKLEGPDDVFAFEIRNYLPDDLLCLVDRTSMANSLELRVPFMDVRLVEFMAGAPLTLKTRGFNLKYLLKKAMAGKLPPEILKAGKMGFQVPLARWYNEEIRSFAHDVLSPAALRKSGYLNPPYIEVLLKTHESGRRNLSDQIYAAMMFELWLANAAKKRELKDISGAVSVNGRAEKKILLVNVAGLGDIIMMTPVLRKLRSEYPSSKIYLLTIDRSVGLARLLPGLEEIFHIPVYYKLPDIDGLWTLFKTLRVLRKMKFDMLLNLKLVSSAAGAWKIRLLNYFVSPVVSIGRCLEGNPGIFDEVLYEHVIEKKSEVDLTAGLLKPLGIEVTDLSIRLDVSDKDMKFADAELERLGLAGVRLVGFNPGAFRPSRRWPLENWGALAKLLLDKYPDMRMVVSGSRQEAAEYSCLKISDRVVILDGAYDMGQLAAIFKKMALFITNDTGPMHIAAAVGTRVAAIFGPGDVYRFAPSVPKALYRVIRTAIPGCEYPCYKFRCPNPLCLTAIKPAEVFEKARELLEDTGKPA